MEKKRRREWWFLCLLVLLAAGGIVFLLYPVAALMLDAAGAYLHTWGVLPGIGRVLLQTLLQLLCVIALVVPLSFLILLQLLHHRNRRISGAVRVSIANVSRIPAVLMGVLGYALLRGRETESMLLPMALLLTVMFLPASVFRLERAISALPEEYHMAGMALGGKPLAIFWRILLPKALPELTRTMLELVEDILCEATALLMLLAGLDPEQVLATELFRLAYLGRADASVLAFLLMAGMIALRLLTAHRWKQEREEISCQYNWW